MFGLIREITDMLVVVTEQPRWCRYAEYMGSHRCESMILGSMTFLLKRVGLLPLPKAPNTTYSIVSLYRQLATMVLHDIGQPKETGSDHAECNPRGFILRRLHQLILEMADPVLGLHRQNIERKAENIGFFQ